MRTGFKMLAVLALVALIAMGAGWAKSEKNVATITTPTGALSARDSVAVDTLTINFSGHGLAKFEISADLTSMTRVDYTLYVSDDDGTSWTQLTEALDSLYQVQTIGTAGTMRCTADSMATYWIGRPGYFSFADTLAQYKELYDATHLRLIWTKSVGIDANDAPDIELSYELYDGFPWE